MAAFTEAKDAIHNAQPVRHSLQELYAMVEALCMHKLSAELCERLHKVMEKHTHELISGLVEQTPNQSAFLILVIETWQNYCQQMHSVRNIFLYLDRSYILGEPSLHSLWDMGIEIFRKHLSSLPQVENKIIVGFLDLIQQERLGETINTATCKSITRMLVALEIYEDRFENLFLERTASFYHEESARLRDQYPVADFLVHVEKRLKEEKLRVAHYLDSRSSVALIGLCEKELIASHVSFLLEKGFDTLVNEFRTEDLRRMYSLFARVDALDDMKRAFSANVKQRGVQIMNNADEGDEKEVIPMLLKLNDYLNGLLHNSFCGNEKFERALRDAFESFINMRENRPAELFAKYIDTQLRFGAKGIDGEAETETKLTNVVTLFKLLSAKDVFEAFYKADLAKRLLLGRSASRDLERSMIAKLKGECGHSFTNKLEAMFKDVELSKDLMSQFAIHRNANSKTPIDVEMHVVVLTTGFWPAYPVMPDIKLHPFMSLCQDDFETFYYSKHEGRRLAWQHSHCSCILRAMLPDSSGNLVRKELQVSLYQALVLLLFNSCVNPFDGFSYKRIKAETGIEANELRRTLQSLACGKVKLLQKEPKGREIDDGNVFSLVQNFDEKQYRIKINAIQMKQTAKEKKDTSDRVFQDRQYQVDAAIVRVMKTRKTLGHQELIQELFRHLRFPVTTADLKKRIESLIDREYLERGTEIETYSYLA